jgi:transcriptional regulator
MYTSAFFGERNQGEIRALIDRHGLALLTSHSATHGVEATAVPALFDPDDSTGGRIIAHMARANEHWRRIVDGDPVLLVFQGPNAYVTPRHYVAEEDVPTWNYSAVQVRGTLTHAHDPAENMRVLTRTVEHFERVWGEGWSMDEIDPKVVDMYARGTASFSIAVTSIEAAHKMSQDKREADVAAVIDGLSRSEDDQARAVARIIERVTFCPRRFQPEPKV